MPKSWNKIQMNQVEQKRAYLQRSNLYTKILHTKIPFEKIEIADNINIFLIWGSQQRTPITDKQSKTEKRPPHLLKLVEEKRRNYIQFKIESLYWM